MKNKNLFIEKCLTEQKTLLLLSLGEVDKTLCQCNSYFVFFLSHNLQIIDPDVLDTILQKISSVPDLMPLMLIPDATGKKINLFESWSKHQNLKFLPNITWFSGFKLDLLKTKNLGKFDLRKFDAHHSNNLSLNFTQEEWDDFKTESLIRIAELESQKLFTKSTKSFNNLLNSIVYFTIISNYYYAQKEVIKSLELEMLQFTEDSERLSSSSEILKNHEQVSLKIQTAHFKLILDGRKTAKECLRVLSHFNFKESKGY